MDKLFIIMPAYNEEETIETVAKEWHEVVVRTGEGSRLLIINDGSKDSTYDKLEHLANELPLLLPITKINSGHGGTVLYGYKEALKLGAEYIFQTDSDGQTIPDEFWQLWDVRKNFEIQLGYRKKRQDGISRRIVTKTLKLVLFFFFGLWITDVNTPFRLMSASSLKKYVSQIPQDYNLSNVLLTVLYEKNKAVLRYAPITFRPRQGGENSINFKRICKIGYQATKDFSMLKKQI